MERVIIASSRLALTAKHDEEDIPLVRNREGLRPVHASGESAYVW